MALDLAIGGGGPQRRLFAHFPGHVALIVFGVSALSVWNLASACRTTDPDKWLSQVIWLAAFGALALAICLLDYRTFMRAAYWFYGIVLLTLVLVLWKGRVVMGARRWLSVGPVGLQPSELAK